MRYAIGRRLFRWGLQLMGFPPAEVVAFHDPWFGRAADHHYFQALAWMRGASQSPSCIATILPLERRRDRHIP